MYNKKEESEFGIKEPIGSRHYRAFVGPPQKYDLVAANQFSLLTLLGLREYHHMLDIGCGSLRGGRLFIPYLLPGRYFGVEPEEWLVKEGIKNNLGEDILNIKHPRFSYNNEFTFNVFNQSFDFILAQSIFSHATQDQIRRCFAEAKKVMKESSLFVATFVKGEKNNHSDKWLYPECGTYTLEFMSSLAQEQELRLEELKWRHPNNQTWVVIGLKENRSLPDL